MEVSKILAIKEKKFTVITDKMGQYWYIRIYLIEFNSREKQSWWDELYRLMVVFSVHRLGKTRNFVDSIKDISSICITNFIQLVSPQQVDWFSQTKLHWKAPNEGYLHICRMYKSDNKQSRYQAISGYKSFVC